MLGAVFIAVACQSGDGGENSGTPEATEPPQSSECPPPSGKAPDPMAKSYPQPPAMSIDPAQTYRALVKTVRGEFAIELRPALAPQHVNSFVFLARDGYYDGVTFHRVVAGFVAQAGDPTGTGSGGPGYTLALEPSDVPFERGVVGMARTQDPNSAGSQWFVTFGNASHLNGQYTVFGTVTQGMEVVDCIQQGDAIVSVEIQEG